MHAKSGLLQGRANGRTHSMVDMLQAASDAVHNCAAIRCSERRRPSSILPRPCDTVRKLSSMDTVRRVSNALRRSSAIGSISASLHSLAEEGEEPAQAACDSPSAKRRSGGQAASEAMPMPVGLEELRRHSHGKSRRMSTFGQRGKSLAYPCEEALSAT